MIGKGLGNDAVRRRSIAGLVDIIEVDDPGEIRALANSDAIDRRFAMRTCPINWLLLKRSLSVLSFRGRRFPTMRPRTCAVRAQAQDALWAKLNARVENIRGGPEELDPLAKWVRGVSPAADVGILAQDLLGKLFRDDFTATEETWAAAKILVAAPRSSNPMKLAWWFLSGKVRRAKRVLASTVADDLSAVNAIGIAVHNLAKSLRYMQSLQADSQTRRTLSAREAAEKCLRAPVSVYRQATAEGSLAGTTYRRNTLFVLNIGAAAQLEGGRDLVFMERSWSRCPAATWIPALLEGVWTRALFLDDIGS